MVGLAAQMGTITFHPWPVRSDDVDHPDELRIDLDPQDGTDFADAVRVAGEARSLLGELGYAGFPKREWRVCRFAAHEPEWTTNARLIRLYERKPGVGLEPTTPSLPWKCSTD